MTGILNLLAGAVSSAIKDTYFNLTTLLLPGDGTNGAQNNTFLDSSSNNFTITRNGNTTQGTFSPFSQTGWSNYFPASALGVSTAQTQLAMGSGSFTLEYWFNSGSTANTRAFGNGQGGAFAANRWVVAYNNTAGKVELYVFNYNSSTPILASTSSTITSDNTWHHVAIVRSSNTWAMFIDGTRQGSSVTSSVALDGGTSETFIVSGSNLSGDTSYTGYLSNVRFTKGGALYDPTQTTISVPTSPLTTTVSAGTVSVLTCQSNRFVDNSANNFSLTVYVTPSVQAFSPFAPTAAYSAATVGGSGYFDGSGDYLSFASNAAFTVGTGNLTIEAWIYVTSLSQAYQGIASGRADTSPNFPGLGLTIDNSQLLFTILNSGSGLRDSANVPLNQWVHVVGVRSGTNAALFVNGTRKASSTNSEDGTSSDMVIGRYYVGTNNYYLSGYIAGARLLKGTAAYDPTQTSITVPTAPFTNVTNTSFLTNFTNAGITDATAKNDLETVGNAQISTTQSKFGGSSMYFDGTGDGLYFPTNIPFISSGDFTVEGWFYTGSSSNQTLISLNSSASTGYAAMRIDFEGSTGKLFLLCSANNSSWGVNVGTTNTISINTWAYFAVVRSGSSFTVYINGTSGATATLSGALYAGAASYIGCNYASGSLAQSVNGYLDDIRVTRYARTIAASPTAAFPLQ